MTAPSEVTVSDYDPGSPETWKSMAGIGFSGYEASRDSVCRLGEDGKLARVSGGIRSVDRLSGNRRLRGVLLKPGRHEDGYPMVKVTDDAGKQWNRTEHSLILATFAGPCPPGMESCHLDDDPLNNRWAPGDTEDEVRAAGGNLIYGTKKQNAGHKFRNGGQAPTPKAYECINHARCGGMVANPGRRCGPCAVETGKAAAVMLNAGVPLEVVARELGYETCQWVLKLAARYGGYDGIPARESQPPPRSRGVMTTLRGIFGRKGR